MSRKARDEALEEQKRYSYQLRIKAFESVPILFPIEAIGHKSLRIASDLWANARLGSYATDDDRSVDFDVILAAMAIRLGRGGRGVTVITTNVRHLERFTHASTWDAY